jgi:hypothetical protein
MTKRPYYQGNHQTPVPICSSKRKNWDTFRANSDDASQASQESQRQQIDSSTAIGQISYLV